ncbi:hypothetical protein ACFRMN_36585 [Streptomyces sp. NPDC056835]|uniref:hypothetical protein n=1 Tax=Streptomyces sp. NPDC056835 TaxID=3345956 RepID=UPI0036A46B47
MDRPRAIGGASATTRDVVPRGRQIDEAGPYDRRMGRKGREWVRTEWDWDRSYERPAALLA